MSKILLIYPSQFYSPYWGNKNLIKAHMLNLHSFLKINKLKVETLDLENDIGRPKTEDEIITFRRKAYNRISEFDFDFIGISCWTSHNYLSSIMVAEICKNVNSNCVITVGGYHPTALPSDFIYKESPFDFIIRGEGEIILKKICKNEERKRNHPVVINGAPLEMKKDFVLDWESYGYCDSAKEIPIYLSRGCPFTCSFCMETSKENRNWRVYPVDIALNKINKIIYTLEPTQISITDACFGYNKSWRKEFLNCLKKEKINNFFWVETRIDILDKDDIDLFSNLNFEIQLGIESGSEKMLKIMNKTRCPQIYLSKCKDLIDYLNKKEVPYKLLFMFNHPGETYETYMNTLKFLKSLIKDQKKISGVFGGQTFSFFPGSYAHHNLKEYHQKYGTIIKHKEWWKQKGDHYRLSTSIIPCEELLKKFSNLYYFQKDIDDLNQEILKKMPEGLRTFWARKI